MCKKVLLVATRKFWPVNSGKDLTLFYNCKGLNERYGYKVFVYCMDSETNPHMPVPAFIEEVKFLGRISLLERFCNLIRYSVFGAKWPIQIALYRSKRAIRELQSYFNEINPDVVFIDMIRLAPYSEIFFSQECKKILIMDDDLAKRYKRQLATQAADSDVMGAYSDKLPKSIRCILHLNFLKSAILKFEIPRIEKAECKIIPLYDYITYISPVERDEFEMRHHSGKGVLLTVGTNLPSVDSRENKIIKRRNTLVFVGNFSVAANVDSLTMIVAKVLPKLRKDAVLHVIGKCPRVLSEKFQDNIRVKMHGRVENLVQEIMTCMIYIAPIAYGTGIKSKIIEAMGMSMPVVTNTMGVEGIVARNGVDVFVRDDFDEMAAIVERLLDDDNLRETIGANARQFVLKNHTWDRVYNAFDEMGL
ncbi:MAG: glycosyltransferase family 4 protein [Oscillospiraceae bacterium]|jgi:glycosyltransferase involved in cell wall biosynthesis|nr:glycosyltransferase family 4 protein [Oscillospiraceae bacterium]